MCHGELALRRPAPQYLTSFYLWMSAGGVIGGIAAGLIAPHVFNWVAEYPILIALAVLCRPGLALPSERRWRYALFGGSRPRPLSWSSARSFPSPSTRPPSTGPSARCWSHACWSGARRCRSPRSSPSSSSPITTSSSRPARRRCAASSASPRSRRPPTASSASCSTEPRCTAASASATPNGQPAPDPPELLLYYWDGSGISQAFDAVRARIGGPIRYAVIGLGAGSLACRARARRHRALLRDRSRHHPHRPRSEPVHLPVGLPAGCADHARRCAAHAGGGARRRLRPHHRRCVLLRRDPDPPAHARGDGDLSEKAQPPRHGGDARVEPAPRARLGGRRHRRGQRPDHARQRQRGYRRGGQSVQVFRHGRRGGAQRGGFRPARASARLGGPGARSAANGCGPTTIPTSSDPCCASSTSRRRMRTANGDRPLIPRYSLSLSSGYPRST